MALSDHKLLELADEAIRRREELQREQRAVDDHLETLAMALGIQPSGLMDRQRQLETRVRIWRGSQFIATP